MAKNKDKDPGTPGRQTYEDVKLYSDVTKKEIKQDKKALLKEMAMAGTAGLHQYDKQIERLGTFDRADAGMQRGTHDAIIDELDRERARMMQGYETALGKGGKLHSKAMDRMAARNVNYLDKINHAAYLAKQSAKERIAAMKLAAEQRAGGGGGGGGGGSRSSGGTIPTDAADQMAEEVAQQAAAINRPHDFDLAASLIDQADISENYKQWTNQPAFQQLDDAWAQAYESGMGFDEAQKMVGDAVADFVTDPSNANKDEAQWLPQAFKLLNASWSNSFDDGHYTNKNGYRVDSGSDMAQAAIKYRVMTGQYVPPEGSANAFAFNQYIPDPAAGPAPQRYAPEMAPYDPRSPQFKPKPKPQFKLNIPQSAVDSYNASKQSPTYSRGGVR